MRWKPGATVCRTSGTPLLKTEVNGEGMGELIVLGILIGVGIWLFKAGKRLGSRKGFNVGRRRFRR